ncbi:MAG: DUF2304 domain-containing protein [Raoultibacter sp.]|jgi:hypothetical protein
MSIVLQVAVIIACLLFIIFVVRLVAKEKLLLKYSLLWIALGLILLLCAIFPTPLYELSHLLGFETPANFIFFVGLFFLLAIALSLSAIASKQKLMIKNLTQEQALLEKRLKNIEENE